MLKRLFDVMAAGLGLILVSPLLLVIAIAVRLTSGSPVLFLHQRVGRGGRPFAMCKFRTMAVAAGKEQGAFDAGDASRVTRVGRVLRKSKLDELPQLWNVVKGDMSLVGPRPEVRKWVDAYPERWGKVLSIRPGITDPASIAYRNEEELLAAADDPDVVYRDEILPKKLDLYEAYVDKHGFWGDVSILWRTVMPRRSGKKDAT